MANFLKMLTFRRLRCRQLSTRRLSTAGEESYNFEEVKKFERMSSNWWNPSGPMKELHSMNRLRIPLIRDGLTQQTQTPNPLGGTNILDVGCGGGILSEPLARLGARVVGLDPGQENIAVAELHMKKSNIRDGRLKYVCSTIEKFVNDYEGERFDGVVSSETIEHVNNAQGFVKCLGECVKPGGSLFITTLNRTVESWIGAIVAWEYVLRRLPVGTHDWNKFITPQELQGILVSNGFRVKLVHGMCYNPISNEWNWTKFTSVNYCIHAVKGFSNL